MAGVHRPCHLAVWIFQIGRMSFEDQTFLLGEKFTTPRQSVGSPDSSMALKRDTSPGPWRVHKSTALGIQVLAIYLLGAQEVFGGPGQPPARRWHFVAG